MYLYYANDILRNLYITLQETTQNKCKIREMRIIKQKEKYTVYQDTVIIPYVKGTEKFRRTGNRFNVRSIFKTKHTLHGTVMKTRLVKDAQQMKHCVYNIPYNCGRCYIGETGIFLELRIKEHKHNLTQGLLEKPKLAQHVYEEGHTIC
jgi:hypothetical protein